jgi:5-amino-6-(5-phosphoribosylamino)uracil reductase
MPSDEQLEIARARVSRLLADGPTQRLIGVVVGSIDGRATINGRVKGLSSPGDQAHLFAWREIADTLLVGDTTLTVERYGSLLPQGMQEARVARNQLPIPSVATISRAGGLDVAKIRRAKQPPDLTVYSEADAPGAVEAEWITQREVTIESVVADLRTRGNKTIVCEGGPTLFGLLFEATLITDLSLTISPLIVGDEGPRVVEAGAAAAPLTLKDADPFEGSVFAHYVV